MFRTPPSTRAGGQDDGSLNKLPQTTLPERDISLSEKGTSLSEKDISLSEKDISRLRETFIKYVNPGMSR